MRFRKPESPADIRPEPSVAGDVAVVRDAYERGRRDERARHRGSPALFTAVALAAVVGGAAMISAAARGSFEGGGRLMDAQLVSAARDAKPALESAALGAQRLIHGDRNDADGK